MGRGRWLSSTTVTPTTVNRKSSQGTSKSSFVFESTSKLHSNGPRYETTSPKKKGSPGCSHSLNLIATLLTNNCTWDRKLHRGPRQNQACISRSVGEKNHLNPVGTWCAVEATAEDPSDANPLQVGRFKLVTHLIVQ
jgi:hypothetical protein